MGFAALLIVSYIGTFFWVVPMIHDATLKKFSAPLLSIPLPEKSKKIDSISIIGQQFANGNHCDYLAATLVETNLSKNDVQEYYNNNYKGKPALKFVWLDERNSYTQNTFNSQTIFSLKEWMGRAPIVASSTFAVYIFESNMTSSFDYRCR